MSDERGGVYIGDGALIQRIKELEHRVDVLQNIAMHAFHYLSFEKKRFEDHGETTDLHRETIRNALNILSKVKK